MEPMSKKRPYSAPSIQEVSRVHLVSMLMETRAEEAANMRIDSGATSVFDFRLSNVIRDVVLRRGSARQLSELFQRDALYPNPYALVTFIIGNHDTKHFMGEPDVTPERLKVALSLLMTVRGIPEIYAGDEIGMPGGDDPDNRQDFRGGFAGDLHNAFTSAGRTPQEQDILHHFKKLSDLGREHPALRGGRQWDLAAGDRYLVFVRENGNDVLLVLFNNSLDKREVDLKLADTPLENIQTILPILGAGTPILQNKVLKIQAMPNTVLIFQVK